MIEMKIVPTLTGAGIEAAHSSIPISCDMPGV
jgi:hypothetical protein